MKGVNPLSKTHRNDKQKQSKAQDCLSRIVACWQILPTDKAFFFMMILMLRTTMIVILVIFFCSLFWEDLDISELYLRRQFRHLVLVTSTSKQNIAALSYYTARRGIHNQHFHFCYFKKLVLLAPGSGRCSLLFSTKDSMHVPNIKIK